jgi:hypothetical protein
MQSERQPRRHEDHEEKSAEENAPGVDCRAKGGETGRDRIFDEFPLLFVPFVA